MERLLSPKTAAEAIGVSESSLRRWADDGKLAFSRTAGGHRRIPLREMVRFVRANRLPVIRPDKLGLDAAPAQATTADDLYDALLRADHHAVEGMVLGGYLSGESATTLFDGPIHDAMTRLGELWHADPRGIMLEHRATQLCVRTVWRLQQVLPTPADTAPAAVICGPERDPYLLSLMMTEATLTESGYRAFNLGPQTPIDSLCHAVESAQSPLACMSLMADLKASATASLLETCGTRLEQLGCRLVVGGHGIRSGAVCAHPNVFPLNSMGELSGYAAGLRLVA